MAAFGQNRPSARFRNLAVLKRRFIGARWLSTGSNIVSCDSQITFAPKAFHAVLGDQLHRRRVWWSSIFATIADVGWPEISCSSVQLRHRHESPSPTIDSSSESVEFVR